jgi:hypothetical protein
VESAQAGCGVRIFTFLKRPFLRALPFEVRNNRMIFGIHFNLKQLWESAAGLFVLMAALVIIFKKTK